MLGDERINRIVGKLNMRGGVVCGPSGNELKKIKEDYKKGLELISRFVGRNPIHDNKMYYINNGGEVMLRTLPLMSDDYVALEYRIPAGSQPQLKISNEDHRGLAAALKSELYDVAGIDCFITD